VIANGNGNIAPRANPLLAASAAWAHKFAAKTLNVFDTTRIRDGLSGSSPRILSEGFPARAGRSDPAMIDPSVVVATHDKRREIERAVQMVSL